MNENEYLTEEELNRLIDDIENSEMIDAPPDILNDILARIDNEENCNNVQEDAQTTIEVAEQIIKPPQLVSSKREYRSYCFRVITTMVAAVAMLLIVPLVKDYVGDFETGGTIDRVEEADREEEADRRLLKQHSYKISDTLSGDYVSSIFGGRRMYDSLDRVE